MKNSVHPLPADDAPSDQEKEEREKEEREKEEREKEEDNVAHEQASFLRVYQFFDEPNSSHWAFRWVAFNTTCALGRIMEVALESCDGPNQYYQRPLNEARYDFLLTEPQYFHLTIALFVPLVIDAFCRVGLLTFIFSSNENLELQDSLRNDTFNQFVFFTEIVAVVPFILNAAYFRPAGIHPGRALTLIFTLLEIMIVGRLLRILKDWPSIRAIRVALSRSATHLILPLFFFFIFNITAGVFMYFMEPCYDINTCPWLDLFQSTFFSIVTMTTTGYGNQVPEYELGRAVACLIMVFGVIFLSMPLAIIGNEYDRAWSMLEQERKEKEQAKERPAEKQKNNDNNNDKNDKNDKDVPKLDEKTQTRNSALYRNTPAILAIRFIRTKLIKIKEECVGLTRMTPSVLLLLCELRAWIPSLIHNCKHLVLEVYGIESRRFSHLHHGMFGSADTVTGAVDVISKKSKLNYKNVEVMKLRRGELNFQSEHTNGNLGLMSQNSIRITPTATEVRDTEEINHTKNPADSPTFTSTFQKSVRHARMSLRAISADFNNEIPSQAPRSWFARKAASAKKVMAVTLLRIIGEEDIRRRTTSEDFLRRMEKVAENPNAIRNRLWIMMELPHSSQEARLLQLILLFLISLSIFLLYTQTVVSLTPYGPPTAVCGKTIQIYCSNKNYYTDPGCYQFYPNTTEFILDPDTNEPLPVVFEYSKANNGLGCTSAACYGQAGNFGSRYSLLSCNDAAYPPFQDADQLAYTYGLPYTLHTRSRMHKINAICSRVECTQNSGDQYDANLIWIVLEFVINIFFTVELIVRIFITDTLWEFFHDRMNIFDAMSIAPFYVELFNTLSVKTFAQLDFSILASSPEPILMVSLRSLKVFRMLKLTRHFQASKVIEETARKVWRQILAMLGLLAFLTVLFAILLYEVERGTKCFVGCSEDDDPTSETCMKALEGGNLCEYIPENVVNIVKPGEMLLINKNGELSQFGNIFFGLWFSFVTLTTVGYGDILPVTNMGQVMAIFLMVAGTFYMAMPLTAAASTFYTVHERYEEKIHAYDNMETTEKSGGSGDNNNNNNNNNNNHSGEEALRISQSVEHLCGEMNKMEKNMDVYFNELRSPVSELQGATGTGAGGGGGGGGEGANSRKSVRDRPKPSRGSAREVLRDKDNGKDNEGNEGTEGDNDSVFSVMGIGDAGPVSDAEEEELYEDGQMKRSIIESTKDGEGGAAVENGEDEDDDDEDEGDTFDIYHNTMSERRKSSVAKGNRKQSLNSSRANYTSFIKVGPKSPEWSNMSCIEKVKALVQPIDDLTTGEAGIEIEALVLEFLLKKK